MNAQQQQLETNHQFHQISSSSNVSMQSQMMQPQMANVDLTDRTQQQIMEQSRLKPRPMQYRQQMQQNFTQIKQTRQLPQPGQSTHDHLGTDPNKTRRPNFISSDQTHHYFSVSEEDNEEEEAMNQGAEQRTQQPGKKKTTTSSRVDKSDEALRLLSELKLSEQAKEVMEQQQLLIKHSQELLKLQLEQQALSQSVGKTKIIRQTTSDSNEVGEARSNEAKTKGEASQKSVDNQIEPASPRETEVDDEQAGKHADSSLDDATFTDNESRRDKLAKTNSINKKATSFCDDHECDVDVNSAKVSGSVKSRNMHECHESRQAGERRQTSTATNTSTLCSTSVQTSPRCSRDLSHSPADTTDSEMEPVSHALNSRQPHRYQLRPKGSNNSKSQQVAPSSGIIRRREPTGLPPSPLPVAAAIQLHQMKQQHFKAQQAKGGGNSSSRYLRSRSVTSSPTHLNQTNDYTPSGYLTDHGNSGQLSRNRRANSPETLSEFGGQRRRKRLPEPPLNAVPMTPSMVRKMVQAQRGSSGLANTGKITASVNAQWTSLTNAHAGSTFDRTSQQPAGSQPSRLLSSSGSSDAQQRAAKASLTASSCTPAAGSSAPASRHELAARASLTAPASSAAPDLNKFLTSTYGSSILKSTITDVKETPELDKLISNLDDYYGLEPGKRAAHVRLAGETQPDGSPATGISLANRSPAPLHQPRPRYPGLPALSSGSWRRNSEGESGALASLSARPLAGRPYQPLRAPASTTATGSSLLSSDNYANRTSYGGLSGSLGSTARTSTLVGAPYPASNHLAARSLLARQSSLVGLNPTDRLLDSNNNNNDPLSTWTSANRPSYLQSLDAADSFDSHNLRPSNNTSDLYSPLATSKYRPGYSSLNSARHKYSSHLADGDPYKYSAHEFSSNSAPHNSYLSRYQPIPASVRWTFDGLDWSALDASRAGACLPFPSDKLATISATASRPAPTSGLYGRQRSFDLDSR